MTDEQLHAMRQSGVHITAVAVAASVARCQILCSPVVEKRFYMILTLAIPRSVSKISKIEKEMRRIIKKKKNKILCDQLSL